jgi:hypothetical protein
MRGRHRRDRSRTRWGGVLGALLVAAPFATLAPMAAYAEDPPLVLGNVPWPQIGVALAGTLSLSGPVTTSAHAGSFTYAQDTPTSQSTTCTFVQPDGLWDDHGYSAGNGCTSTIADGTYTALGCDVATLAGTVELTAQNEMLRMAVEVAFTGVTGAVTGRFWRDDGSTGDVRGTMQATSYDGTPACGTSFHVETAMYLTPDGMTSSTGLLLAPVNAEQAAAAAAHEPDVAALAHKQETVAFNAPQVSAWLAQNAALETGPDDPCPHVGCLNPRTASECLAQPGAGPTLPEPFCQAPPPPPPPRRPRSTPRPSAARRRRRSGGTAFPPRPRSC